MAAHRTKITTSVPGDTTDNPIVWFAVLARARVTGDLKLARQARRALARDGIYVLHSLDLATLASRGNRTQLQRLALHVGDLLDGLHGVTV
jgi:hypothetical protein